jgi:hypothetical protein
MFNRFTNGPLGYSFSETSTGEISNVTIRDTHDDAVTLMLDWEIGGNTYSSGNAAVLLAMRSDRRFYMMHRGISWPVKFGVYNDVESTNALIAYTSVANQVVFRANTDTVTADIGANDITSFTNGTGAERINFNRLRVSGPSAHVAGNWSATGFGGSPTVTPDSRDSGGLVSVLTGAGPAGSATLTLTFANGTWPTPPNVTATRCDTFATAGEWRVTSVTTSQVTFQFMGTPISGETYELRFMVIG